MSIKITEHLLRSFIRCRYKAHLLLTGESGEKTDYEILQDELKVGYFKKARNVLVGQQIPSDPDFIHDIGSGKELIVGISLSHENTAGFFDALIKSRGTSSFGDFHYIPFIFSPNNKILQEDKLLLAFRGLIIGGLQERMPIYGKFVLGPDCKILKTGLEGYIDKVMRLIDELSICANQVPPLVLNRNCEICEFKKRCREAAIKDENLSLLGQISAKEVQKKNKKGIFTLTQLSYTFRPRRSRKRPDGYKRPHSIALRALAVREKKTYIHGKPVLPQALTEIFFDVEGLEDNFVYLLGIVVVTGGRVEKRSFWADKAEEETEIFLKCLRIVDCYDDYVLYHYGSYELSYLRRMKKRGAVDAQKVDRMIGKACNLLSVFFSNVYVPTYTNGLKEIGNFLGFQWSEKEASGIQSIVWRKRWEMSRLVEYKEKLIKYNIEDCLALLVVKAFLDRIIGKTSTEDHRINDDGVSDIVILENLKRSSPFKFLTGEFALPEFETLNNCAHFDYQRARVHVRTNTYLRKYYSKATASKKRKDYCPNKSIPEPKREACPFCNKIAKKCFKALSKKIIDLRFSKSGVKRWVTQLNSRIYYCQKCKKEFIPQWYKNVEKKYGHDLMAWTMYRYVVGGQSFRQITSDSRELFGIHVAKSNAHIFKSYIMEYYQETFERIGKNILNSPVIYVDETPIKMTFESGYAWVLTNTEEVVSFYRPNREGEFIKKYLADFKGVLVTDFYSAYDSLPCLQQKCLIHLIRDFNDDILKNPFDEEFKNMAKRFTFLLQDIVATIDKFGLKKRHLGKHNKAVAIFLKNILVTDFGSEVAKQYQKRFLKNQEKLFLFLNYDNVWWNNNAAEHAIKLLATHKNKKLACFRESRMEEYLKIIRALLPNVQI